MSLQGEFASALLDPERDVPHGVVAPDGRVDRKRFNVYRNNVVVSLASALEAAYPAVREIVGHEFFRAMALVHARAHPPTDPRMILYGGAFPNFLETFEPAAHLAYLPDVARLERARREAYHAADANAGGQEKLAALPPEVLADTRLNLAPIGSDHRLVASDFCDLALQHDRGSDTN